MSIKKTITGKARNYVSFSRDDVFPAIIITLGLSVPFLAPSHITALMIEIMFLLIYAMSLDLLMGYTGLVSFGHAAFFGTGAYICALVLIHFTQWTPLAIVVGIIAAGVVAVPIGYFSIIRRGIYFAMLTLAFSQIMYVAVLNNILDLTGGSDGLVGLPSGNFGIPGVYDIGLTQTGFYYLWFASAVVTYVLLRRIVNSPFGSVLKAIRENEERAQYVGYDVQRYKLIAFTVSSLFAGAAGAMYAPFFTAVRPDLLFWFFSGEGVVIVLLGGMGTLVGSVLGAGMFVGLREIVSPILQDWTIVLGVVFIVFILFLPNGMISILDIIKEKLRDRH